jgi:hypothetical protein
MPWVPVLPALGPRGPLWASKARRASARTAPISVLCRKCLVSSVLNTYDTRHYSASRLHAGGDTTTCRRGHDYMPEGTRLHAGGDTTTCRRGHDYMPEGKHEGWGRAATSEGK